MDKIDLFPLLSQEEFDKRAIPMTFPLPVEIAEDVLTSDDLDRIAKAQAKRERKNKNKS